MGIFLPTTHTPGFSAAGKPGLFAPPRTCPRTQPLLRALLVVLVMTGIGQSVGAQTRAHMIMGVSAYTIVGPDVDMQPVYRLSGGGGLSFPLAYGLGVRPELKYTVQGGRTRGTISGSVDGEPAEIPVTATFDLTYVEIPVLLTFGMEFPNGVQLELGAGPGLGFKADTRWRLSAETGPEFDQGISEAPGRITGLSVAGDLILPFRGERLLLGVRGWFSRTEAGLEGVLPGRTDLKSRGFTFLSGIVF